MSQLPFPQESSDPGNGVQDDELIALIAGYRQLHQDDDRLRRIERRSYLRRPAVGGGPEDRIVEVRDEEAAPELRTRDARRVAAGILRTEEDLAVYAARFASAASPHDPGGKDLDRQAHAMDAAGTQWLVMIGQNRDHGLVACRFVREKGIPHARVVSFTADRLPLPVVVVELEPGSRA